MESVVDGHGGGSRLVVMAELSRIKELVKQLDVQLQDCPDLCKHLAEQIFTVTERSIGMICSGSFDGRKRSAISAGLDSPQLSESATPSPLRTNKKRKMMAKGNHQVRVSSGGGGAETLDDGYSWRKYGQKEILGAQHPSLMKSLSSSLTLNTEGLTSGSQQSTPFSFSSPPGHYPSSTPSTPENCFGQGVLFSPYRLELSPATSDSSCYPMNHFEAEWKVQSELQQLVSVLVDATSTPAVEETTFSLDGFEFFDFDTNFDV